MAQHTLNDVTPSQIRVLSTIVAVNRDRQTPVTDWVEQRAQHLTKNSVRALEAKGIVKYDPRLGVVRVLRRYAPLAVEAYQVLTGDRS